MLGIVFYDEQAHCPMFTQVGADANCGAAPTTNRNSPLPNA